MKKSIVDAVRFLNQLVDRHVRVGEITAPNGGRIVCPRPKLAPKAQLHYLFPASSEENISLIAQLTHRQPHPDLHKFLSFHNGINLFGGSLTVYGVRQHYDRTPEAALWQPYDIGPVNWAAKKISKDDMVIGGLGDDNKIVLCKNGTAVRMDYAVEKVLEKWPDFATLLMSEADRFSKCYDAEGYLKTPLPDCAGKIPPRNDQNMYEISRRANRPMARIKRWLNTS